MSSSTDCTGRCTSISGSGDKIHAIPVNLPYCQRQSSAVTVHFKGLYSLGGGYSLLTDLTTSVNFCCFHEHSISVRLKLCTAWITIAAA